MYTVILNGNSAVKSRLITTFTVSPKFQIVCFVSRNYLEWMVDLPWSQETCKDKLDMYLSSKVINSL